MEKIEAEQLEMAANMLKAIAHPLRIQIINELIENEYLAVSQIHEKLGIEQSTASHHLGILKDKGILNSKRDGKNCYYYLKQKKISDIISCIKQCAV
jgi:DNA-binding transcriptional ArsR family regulator